MAKRVNEIIATVLTHDGKSGKLGFGKPTVKVKIEMSEQGISVNLPRSGSVDMIDIYMERREGKWFIGLCPDSTDHKAVVYVSDDGSMQVQDGPGNVVFECKTMI